jgi:DamX protein
MAANNNALNYIAALNLNRDPFSPEPDLTFLYEYESLAKTFALLKRLVQGKEIIVLVIGEVGSGKTSLLKRYLTSTKSGWKSCRIQIHPRSDTEKTQPALFKDVDSYPAYVLQDATDATIIIDDAHKLDSQQLAFLLKNTQSSDSSRHVRRFVFLGESLLDETITALTKTLSGEIAVSKIFLPSMTQEQTKVYLDNRLAVAGYVGKSLFNSSAVKKIHRSSGGFPGRINTMADQQLNEDFSRRRQRQGSFSSRLRPHRHIFGWAAAALIIVVIFFFGVYHFRGKSESDSHRIVQKIFRGKIEISDHLAPTPPLVSESKFSEKNISETSEDTPETGSLETETGQPPPNKLPAEKPIESITPAETPIEIAKAPEPPPVPKPVVESETPAEKENNEKQTVYRENWLLSQRSSDFTIQILGVRSERRILDFIDNKLTSEPADIAYYKTSYKGKDWYPLLFGIYATKKEASSAIKLMPPDIQKASPWIRKMSSIQRAIRKHASP